MKEQEAKRNIGHLATEIQLRLAMVKAIQESFGAEYVDISDDEVIRIIASDIDNYRGLFNAMCHLTNEVIDLADEAEILTLSLRP